MSKDMEIWEFGQLDDVAKCVKRHIAYGDSPPDINMRFSRGGDLWDIQVVVRKVSDADTW